MQVSVLSQSSSSVSSTNSDKAQKKSLFHRILNRWKKPHKPSAEESTYNLKKLRSTKSIKRRMQVKMILLGTPNSGKSTIAKQMKILYQDGYTHEQRREMIPAIQYYILSSIKDVLHGIYKLNIALSPESLNIAQHISSLPKQCNWTPALVGMMKTLLLDKAMSKFLLKCEELQIYDNLASLLTHLDSFISTDYVPTNDDILATHTRTSGVVEHKFKLNEHMYSTLDFGGSRADQRKWLFFFEFTNAVIFVVGLNEYDMRCREEPELNSMHESLKLFSQIVNNVHFRNTPIFLFLNKADLLRQKIRRSPLNACFPEYTGGSDYDLAIKFIENKFTSLATNPDQKIFTHATCAIGDMQGVATEVMQRLNSC